MHTAHESPVHLKCNHLTISSRGYRKINSSFILENDLIQKDSFTLKKETSKLADYYYRYSSLLIFLLQKKESLHNSVESVMLSR